MTDDGSAAEPRGTDEFEDDDKADDTPRKDTKRDLHAMVFSPPSGALHWLFRSRLDGFVARLEARVATRRSQGVASLPWKRSSRTVWTRAARGRTSAATGLVRAILRFNGKKRRR